MEYQFEKFKGRNTRQETRITITKSNQLGFPTQFYKDNKIKDFKYVILFWDEKNRAIGIYFTNEKEDKSCFSVIHSHKYGGGVIARSFFKAYKINPKIYHGRYEWKKQKLEGVGVLYIIELKEQAEG